jgi:hypothetical protein
MMDENILIKLLEHGENAGQTGITKADALEWFALTASVGPVSDPGAANREEDFLALFYECFEPAPPTQQEADPKRYRLAPQYRIRLIEYRSRQRGTQTAARALKISSAALVLFVATVIFGLFWAQSRPSGQPSVSDAQLKKIAETVLSAEPRDVRLDRLQMMQIISAIEAKKDTAGQRPPATIPSNEIEHHDLINRYFEENQ